MRAVIQRVSEASVTIGGREKAAIGNGLLVLLGIGEADSGADIEWLSGKIARLRIFSDRNQLMNLSVQDVQGKILVISQFTLFADTKKGNRPSFIRAAKPDRAIPLYNKFLEQLEKDLAAPVHSGEFGADMKIKLINDGPVTLVIDTKNKDA
jgi:D-aminoacyl-tRNA deacylase